MCNGVTQSNLNGDIGTAPDGKKSQGKSDMVVNGRNIIQPKKSGEPKQSCEEKRKRTGAQRKKESIRTEN